MFGWWKSAGKCGKRKGEMRKEEAEEGNFVIKFIKLGGLMCRLKFANMTGYI